MTLRTSLVALVLSAGLAGLLFGFLREGDGPAPLAAATKFTSTLNDEQKKVVLLPYDSPKRLDWHFIPKAQRKGLQIKEMNPEQRKAAHDLLQSVLSQLGYEKATAIMQLETMLNALEKGKGPNIRDPERYYFSLFGTPGEKGRWGLSIEGHHLSLNFVFSGGKVEACTPTVFCTNPAIVMSDVEGSPVKKGTRVIKDEEELGFKLVQALNADQLKKTMIAEKAPADVRAAGEAQPPKTTAEGIAASELTKEQKETLSKLIDAYAKNWPAAIAAERLAAIEKDGLDKVKFCWAGATKPGVGHYYRVQGPTFLIEFVNIQPDAAGNPANHIHSVWRDMRGDFGLPIQ